MNNIYLFFSDKNKKDEHYKKTGHQTIEVTLNKRQKTLENGFNLTTYITYVNIILFKY